MARRSPEGGAGGGSSQSESSIDTVDRQASVSSTQPEQGSRGESSGFAGRIRATLRIARDKIARTADSLNDRLWDTGSVGSVDEARWRTAMREEAMRANAETVRPDESSIDTVDRQAQSTSQGGTNPNQAGQGGNTPPNQAGQGGQPAPRLRHPGTPPVMPAQGGTNPNQGPANPNRRTLADIIEENELIDDAQNLLASRRHEYSRETARESKKMWARFVKSNNFFSKVARKIPGVNRIADAFNAKFTSHSRIDQAERSYNEAVVEARSLRVEQLRADARERYEDTIADLAAQHAAGTITSQEFADMSREALNTTRQDLRTQQLSLLRSEHAALEADVISERHLQSKKANAFSNLWARQKGIKGVLVKGLMLGGVGAIAGATVMTGGLALGASAALAGGLAVGTGGLVGAGIGNDLRHRISNSVVDKSTGMTVAEQDSGRHREESRQAIEDVVRRNPQLWSIGMLQTHRGDPVDVEAAIQEATDNIIRRNEQLMADANKRNRDTFRAAIVGVALGAKGGAMGVEFIHDSGVVDKIGSWLDGRVNPDGGGAEGGGSAGGGDGANSFEGRTVDINTNEAPEHALRDLAEQFGTKISPEQADRILSEMYDKFGDGVFIDADNGEVIDLTRFKDPNIGVGYQEWMRGRTISFGSQEAADFFENAIRR